MTLVTKLDVDPIIMEGCLPVTAGATKAPVMIPAVHSSPNRVDRLSFSSMGFLAESATDGVAGEAIGCFVDGMGTMTVGDALIAA